MTQEVKDRKVSFELISILLASACGLVVLGHAAALKGWISSPSLPWHLGDISVWALAAFCVK